MSLVVTYIAFGNEYTVKPVNKGHPMERQNMAFIDKWFNLQVPLFYQNY